MRLQKCFFPLLSVCIVMPQSAFGYSEDTHYYFTYVAARLSGYTPDQAWRLASMDQGVDDSSEVEPLQTDRSYYDGAAFIAKYLASNSDTPQSEFNIYPTWHPYAFDIRRDFHAFRDEQYNVAHRRIGFQFGADPSAEKDIAAQFVSLYDNSLFLENPGGAMHFLQDSYAHAGYYSKWGHTFSGGVPDCVGFNSEWNANRNYDMAVRTTTALIPWLQAHHAQPARIFSNNEVKAIWNIIATSNSVVPPHTARRLYAGSHINFPAIYDFFKHDPDLLKTRNDLNNNYYRYMTGSGITTKSLSNQLTRNGNLIGIMPNAANWFKLFAAAMLEITYTPNKAGLYLGKGTLQLNYSDPWGDFNNPMHPLYKTAVPERGTAATFDNTPVGPLNYNLVTPYWALNSGLHFHDGVKPFNGRLVVGFNGLRISDNSQQQSGQVTMNHFKFSVDFSHYPTGSIDASFTIKDSMTNAKTLLWFAGGGTAPSACQIDRLNWSGFKISRSNVWINAGAAFGTGVLQMDKDANGNWLLGFQVVPRNPKVPATYAGAFRLSNSDVHLNPDVSTSFSEH